MKELCSMSIFLFQLFMLTVPYSQIYTYLSGGICFQVVEIFSQISFLISRGDFLTHLLMMRQVAIGKGVRHANYLGSIQHSLFSIYLTLQYIITHTTKCLLNIEFVSFSWRQIWQNSSYFFISSNVWCNILVNKWTNKFGRCWEELFFTRKLFIEVQYEDS